uniref:AAA family ATPase n=1 Tax=Niallia taxi TaxID=2499688 RepID=UPI003F4960A1
MFTLSHYKINNFKNIRSSGPIAKEKFTVLSGVNSGGKSSIIQGLLLLKDLVNGKNDYQIDFTGTHSQLGDFEDVLNKDRNKDTIDLEFEILFEKNASFDNLFVDLSKSIEGISLTRNKKEINANMINIKVIFSFGSIKENSKRREYVGVRKYFVSFNYGEKYVFLDITYDLESNSYKVKSNRYDIVFKDEFMDFLMEKPSYIFKETTQDYFQRNLNTKLSNLTRISFDNLLYPTFIYNGNSYINKKKSSVFFSDLFNSKIKKVLETLTDQITYLGPLREEPKLSYYTSGVNKGNIGVKGENAPRIFYHSSHKTFRFVLPPYDEEETFISSFNKSSLSKLVSAWASYILGTKVNYVVHKYTTESYGLFHKLNNKTNRMTNVGVGASQIFPILIEGIRGGSGGLFVLEQPEIHLHPLAQARLADFLIGISLSKNKKVLIETHSEHIINRIVRRNIRQEFNQKEVNIIFVDGKQIESIQRDDYGMINEWPNGFLDTGIKENELLYLDQMNRLEAEEENNDL